MNEAAAMLGVTTLLMASSLANADIRPLLRQQGFNAPINGRETIRYVGRIPQGRNDYQIYLYHGVFPPHPGGVDHGINRLIVILNGRTLVGAYNAAMPSNCRVRGTKLNCNIDGRPSVVAFTKRGPPYEILFDGQAEKIFYGNRLTVSRCNERQCAFLTKWEHPAPLESPSLQPPPEAYIDPVDAEIARTGIGTEDRPQPCSYLKKDGKFSFIESLPVDKCVRMEAPKRWVGLWRSEFEGSQFCDQATVRCDFDVKPRVWLNILPCGERCSGKMELFRVEFIGRRTVYPGSYGHLGSYEHYIVADRVISIELVKAPEVP